MTATMPWHAECPLCLDHEDGQRWIALEACGHVIHEQCFERQFCHAVQSGSGDLRCPICRENLGDVDGGMSMWEMCYKVFLPLKKAEGTAAAPHVGGAESGAVVIPETGYEDATQPDIGGGPIPQGAGGHARTKSRKELREEISTLRAELEVKEVQLQEEKRRVGHIKLKETHAKRGLEREIGRLRDEVEEERNKQRRYEKDRVTMRNELESKTLAIKSLQLQIAKQALFQDTNLNLDQIQRRLRGEDSVSAVTVLTSALAARNEEYSKVKYAFEELKQQRGKGAALEGLDLENKKLKNKVRKLAEDNKRLAAKASASAKRKADDAPRGLLPLGEQALRGGARTAELPRAAQDGTIGSRRGAAASFVTKAKPRGNGKPGGSQLIREGYDELGRRTKALKKTHARLEEDVVVSVDEARGIFGTPAGQRIPRGGGEITVPKDRHAAAKSGGLRIEHFFNRNG